MKPVTQTMFNPKPGKPDTGNCFQCALASILELPVEAVPHFYQEEANPAKAMDNIQTWLGRRGLILIEIQFGGENLQMFPCFHLLSGLSPRGDFFHTVVALNGEIVHDPHPSREGLKSYKGASYGFLVAIRPEEMKEK